MALLLQQIVSRIIIQKASTTPMFARDASFTCVAAISLELNSREIF